jgi:HAD superfamily hydrolase (TIGR01459 family)
LKTTLLAHRVQLHNGAHPYPGAVEAVHQLQAAGKAVVVLSNSARRSEATAAKLQEWGFGPITAVLTSGEACYQALAMPGLSPALASLGRKMAVFGYEHHPCELEALFEPAPFASADWVFLQSVETARDGGAPTRLERFPEDYLPFLTQARSRCLPMVCANPDFTVVKPNGEVTIMPGTVAQLYESLGGQVHYIGKPHPLVYTMAMEALAPMPPARVVAVGDSLIHDIAGALDAGWDSVWVTHGIHAAELGVAAGQAQRPDASDLHRVVQTHLGGGPRAPTYIIDACV